MAGAHTAWPRLASDDAERLATHMTNAARKNTSRLCIGLHMFLEKPRSVCKVKAMIPRDCATQKLRWLIHQFLLRSDCQY